MTDRIADPLSPPLRSLSMFDVYSGYVVTQGHNALQSVVMWERVMRVIGGLALFAVAALWLAPDAATGPQVLPLKLVLSLILGGMGLALFWAARTQPQYETQIDLIRGEVRQVLRAASGIEKLMLRVPFGLISGVYVRVNTAVPSASCLFMDLDGVETPVLLGIGGKADLGKVHRRLSSDLATARNQPQPPRPLDRRTPLSAEVQAA